MGIFDILKSKVEEYNEKESNYINDLRERLRNKTDLELQLIAHRLIPSFNKVRRSVECGDYVIKERWKNEYPPYSDIDFYNLTEEEIRNFIEQTKYRDEV